MRRLLCAFLSMCLLLSLFAGMTVSAKTGPLKVNSGTRHVLCEGLSSQAEEYYTGEYSYESLQKLSGAADITSSYAAARNNPLYDALHDLMADTQETYPAYSGYHPDSLATYWQYTDAEDGEYGYLFFYTDISSNNSDESMNREHVWPKSRASFYQNNGGADLHHLRPSIPSVNSAKSNYAFGNVVGAVNNYSSAKIDGKDVIWYSGSSDLIEVRDNIKGDVARILLYVWCRWEQPNLYSDVLAENLPPMDYDDDKNNGKKAIESLETLLAWMAMDPVDEWEMSRNDQTENAQGNRNVFIDYPELAFLVFGQKVPAGMPTPSNPDAACAFTALSNNTSYGTVSVSGNVITASPKTGYEVSGHSVTPVNAATVLRNGNQFTVSSLRDNCTITIYFAAAACSHSETELRGAREATCTATGYTGDTYCKTCSAKLSSGSTIPALGHDYEDGICTRCGEKEPCRHENTERRGQVNATCTEDGYTGDVWCLDCGEKVYAGVTIKAMGHTYKDGVCAKCGAVQSGIELPDDPINPDQPDDPINPDQPDDPVAPGSPECYFEDFSDCRSAWYHEAVDFAVEKGLMNGVGGDKFAPDDSMTRAMIVTVLYREAGSPAVEEASTFTDVPAGKWYSDAIAWAQDNKIVNGVSDTEFAPEDNVTREQIAAILWRCKGQPGAQADLSGFKDTDKISAYAEDAIVWAVSVKILNGDNGNLKPTDNATRAEFACIIMRYLGGSYACESLK